MRLADGDELYLISVAAGSRGGTLDPASDCHKISM
jgi:hypothetical protein